MTISWLLDPFLVAGLILFVNFCVCIFLFLFFLKKRPGVRARRNKDRSDGVTTLKDMRHNKEYMLKDQNGKQKDGMFLKFNKEKGAVPNIDEESNAQTPLLA